MQRTNTCMKTFMSSVVREMHMQTKNIKKMKIKKQNTNFHPLCWQKLNIVITPSGGKNVGKRVLKHYYLTFLRKTLSVFHKIKYVQTL